MMAGTRRPVAAPRCNSRWPGILAWIALASILCCPAAQAADPEGWFGISVAVAGKDLLLNKTIQRLTVTAVTPGSPAAAGGLQVGDEMVEVDGVAVAGKKAREIGPMVRKAEGETLRLLMRRPDGETYTAVLTGARRPD